MRLPRRQFACALLLKIVPNPEPEFAAFSPLNIMEHLHFACWGMGEQPPNKNQSRMANRRGSSDVGGEGICVVLRTTFLHRGAIKIEYDCEIGSYQLPTHDGNIQLEMRPYSPRRGTIDLILVLTRQNPMYANSSSVTQQCCRAAVADPGLKVRPRQTSTSATGLLALVC